MPAHRTALAAALAAGLVLTLAPAASAASATTASPPTPRATWTTLTSEVAAPFGLAVRGGEVWVADGGTVTVSHLVDGHPVPIATGPAKGDVAGIDVARDGTLAYTTSTASHRRTTLVITKAGRPDVVADLAGYEATANPDGRVTYGLRAGASACAKRFIERISGGPATYTGAIDSHPYAVASLGDGSWAVADAGGNDVLRVSATGKVSTIAVLPSQPLLFTADLVAALGGPSCLVGESYRFEAVPTDVERGFGGRLFVTTLPGGPEDPGFGARGSVYRVTPETGHVAKVVSGLSGPTNLAIGTANVLYVAEFFAGKVTKVKDGVKTTFAPLPGALSVEVDGGNVYAGTLGSGGPGTVVRMHR